MQQPRHADRGGAGQLQMIADEQGDRYVRLLIEAVDRRNHDPEGDEVQGRNEIGAKTRAIERTESPVCDIDFPLFRRLRVRSRRRLRR